MTTSFASKPSPLHANGLSPTIQVAIIPSISATYSTTTSTRSPGSSATAPTRRFGLPGT